MVWAKTLELELISATNFGKRGPPQAENFEVWRLPNAFDQLQEGMSGILVRRTKNPNRWGVGAEAGAALRPATAMASYGIEDGCRVENIFAAELSTPNTFCVRSILVKIWWSVQNEAAMMDSKGCPFVLEFLLYWIFLKHHAILTVFRLCRTPETFPDTLHAPQHQIIHLQHKIKI